MPPVRIRAGGIFAWGRVLTDDRRWSGRILRTRIFHPPDRSVYGAGLWSHILRDQLSVTEAEFWACVRDGKMPERGLPVVPREALPADLVHLLLTRVGFPEPEIVVMSKAEAIERLNRYWVEGA